MTKRGGKGKQVIFGSRDDEVLEGTGRNDLIFGFKGDDILDGGAGNDILFGGKGNDYLDGGAGNDLVFGGKGDDWFNYTLSENEGAKDYYDGGKGFDTLQLTLTSAELQLAQGEIDAFKAFLAEGSNKVFHFESFGLSVRGFEDLVIVGVGSGNTAPVAVNDSFEAVEDTALLIPVADLLANDSDAEASALTATVVSDPSSGTLALSSDGSSYTYTPNLNFHGEDTFTYQVSDGELSSGIATVTIQVAPVNDPPAAADDLFAGDEDTVIEGNVLDNDVDVDGDVLSATLVTGPQNGALVLAANGSFTYTPNADFNGEDSFTYQASDGALSDPATVMLQVAPVNDPPVAQNDEVPNTIAAGIRVAVVGGAASTYENAAQQLADSTVFDISADAILVTAYATATEWQAALAAYDVVVIGENGTTVSDYDGSPLFAALRNFLDAGGGVVSTGWFAGEIAAYSTATQRADADYISPAAPALVPSFTRFETITTLDSAHPIAGGITSYTVQGFAHELTATVDTTATVLAQSTDGMVPAIAYDEVALGRSVFVGSLHMAAPGVFDPEATRTGPVDQIFEQAVAWAAGERPLVAATDEDTPLVIDDEFLFANDSDIEGDLLEIAEVMALSALGAAVSINGDGNVRYDPTVSQELQDLAAGDIVEDSFQYKVSDGNGGFSDWASVSLSVLGQADTIV